MLDGSQVDKDTMLCRHWYKYLNMFERPFQSTADLISLHTLIDKIEAMSFTHIAGIVSVCSLSGGESHICGGREVPSSQRLKKRRS